MTLSTKESQVVEYEKLIADLREELKHNDEIMDRVEDKIKGLEIENERLREERNQYKDKAGKLQEEVYQKDYTVENWKNRYKTLMEQNSHLEKENRAVREVVKLWA
jgi:chromosome segregation ATPase